MIRKKGRVLFLLILLFSGINTESEGRNNFYEAGESAIYDLYFKYGLLNSKAGISTLQVTNGYYDGQAVYKMTMTARSIGLASKIFSLNDTMISYMTKDLRPLVYIKEAHEGGDYTQETITYSYTPSGTHITTKRSVNGQLKFNDKLIKQGRIFDMMSVLYYARTINYAGMQKGNVTKVNFLSGKDLVNMDIRYEGTTTMNANNGSKYNCIQLNLFINDKAFANKNDAMKVYLTNDSRHTPIQIESRLKVGATRVILKSSNK